MTRREKSEIIEGLVEKFNAYDHFYIVDATSLSVEATNDFRRRCFKEGIIYQVAKNTLITKSLEKIKSEVNYSSFSETVLKGFSGILFAQEASSTPAKIVKKFRKQKNIDKPILKGASIDGDLFIGEEHLEALSKLKSRIELISEIITMLKSPITNVVAAVQDSKHKLAGIMKALAERKT